MKKMFVGNLPPEATEDTVRELFTQFGTVRSLSIATDVFSGKCKGFASVEMEGHEARAAIAGLDNKFMGSKNLRVRFDEPKTRGGSGGRRFR